MNATMIHHSAILKRLFLLVGILGLHAVIPAPSLGQTLDPPDDGTPDETVGGAALHAATSYPAVPQLLVSDFLQCKEH